MNSIGEDAVARLLRPESIAVVGASARPGSFGASLLDALAGWDFGGAVHAVNPRYDEIAGYPCYATVAAIPEPVDCVIMAVADDRVEGLFAEAAAAGARAAVLFGRCYEPSAPGRARLTERLGAIAREAGMAVCGSNSMGFMNFVDRLRVCGHAPPIPALEGGIGVISHSGSSWSGLVGSQRQLRFNYAVSAGEEIATTMADYLAFLIARPETRVIGCVLETVRDPEAFLAALELADKRDIPVVALKLGRSELGARFALAHSGAIAGSDAAYRAVFERHNVCAVDTLDELADTLELFSRGRAPPGDGLGVVTDSGAERQLIVDLAAPTGLRFAALAPATRAKLEAVLDPGFEPDNPVDSWGDGAYIFEDCLTIMAQDPDVGIVALAVNMVTGRPYLYAQTAAAEAAHNATPKPIVAFGNLHSSICRDEAARLRELGIPVLMGTATALAAIAHFLAYHGRRRRGGVTAARPVPAAAEVVERWRRRLAAAGGAPLDGAESLRLFADFGGPVVAGAVVEGEAEALAAAAGLGYPVVLKTAAPEVLHKSEVGGVALGLADAEALAGAYRDLAAAHGARALVQAQAPPGVEVLLGVVNHEPFGAMVTVALGGVLVELFEDQVTLVPPIAAEQALGALARLKGHALLRGYRGRPAADIGALARAIERLGVLAVALGPLITELDVNPVIVGPDGALAVDALVVPRKIDPKDSREGERP
ncbi:MAG: acetate--CoA ligase family protein [Alphaproteobacteria bacterium]